MLAGWQKVAHLASTAEKTRPTHRHPMDVHGDNFLTKVTDVSLSDLRDDFIVYDDYRLLQFCRAEKNLRFGLPFLWHQRNAHRSPARTTPDETSYWAKPCRS